MSGIVKLIWPGLLPGLNGSAGLMRKHWSKQKKVKDNILVEILSIRNQLGKAPNPCRAVLFRFYASNPMDWDNMASSFKFLFDGLKNAGVIVDDSPSHIHSIECHQIKVKKVDQRMEIHLIPVE